MELLITREQLLERTPIGGNVDTDYIIPHIVTSQDIEVQTVLGTALYDRVLADVVADTLAGDYLYLYNKFVLPMACHYTAATFYLFHAFEVSNGGVLRHQTEVSITPDLSEVRALSEEQKNKAVHYRNRCNDYLCANSSLFPEYTNTTSGTMSPDQSTPNNSWVL